MKKIICFSIILTIVAFSVIASAQIKSLFTSDNESYTVSIATSNNILYVLSSENKLYELSDLNTTPKEIELSVPKSISFYAILADNEKLCGLSYDGKVYLKQGSASDKMIYNKVITLQLPEFSSVQYYDGIIDTNCIYLLFGDADSTSVSSQLVIYDLEENKQRIIPVPNIREICNYHQNKLLVLADDTSNWGKSVLLLYDTIRGTQDKLIALPGGRVSGITYDASTDTIYCAMGGIIYRSIAFSPFEECGILPASTSTITQCVLFNDEYTFFDLAGIYLCDLNVDISSYAKIIISGGVSADAKKAFQDSFPDVIVKEVPYFPDQKGMATSIITQNTTTDIYNIPITLGYFPELKNKGFYTDLAQRDSLISEINNMIPLLTEALWDGNQLCAYPVFAHGRLLSYNKTLWTQMGFSEQDLPKTISEFIDFIVEWTDEYSSQYPDIILYQPTLTAKQQLYRWAIRQYILTFEPNAHDSYFDVQSLRDIFAKIDDAESEINEIDRQNSIYSASVQDSVVKMLFDFEGIMLSSDAVYNDWRPLLLTIDENSLPHEVVQVNALVINPYSQNKDLALNFVECAARTLDVGTRTFLYGDKTTAEERKDFQEYTEQYLHEKHQLNEMISNATPEEKKEYEDKLNALNSEYSWNEKNNRWVISPDAIRRYMELTPYLCPSGANNLFITIYNSSGTLFNRYDDKQITSETFLKELDRIYQMYFLEINP